MERQGQPMILMVGGGLQQVPAVGEARRMGFRVAVTDRNPDAPCMALADESAVVCGRDLDALAAYALSLKDSNLVGVFTLTELVEGACHAAQAAGTPSASTEAARLTMNKSLMKAHWLEQSVACPKGVTVASLKEVESFLDDHAGPLFAKPAIGFGGQGSRAFSSSDGVREFLHGVWKGENGASYLLEERLDGPMYDVNGYFDASGRYCPLGIVRRTFLESAPVEVAISAPSGLDEARQKALHSLLEQGVRALGITDGPVKGDAVSVLGEFRLLEVAPRLHGPKCTLYTLPFSGQPQLEYIFTDFAERAGVAQRLRSISDGVPAYCECRTLRPVNGVITGIHGVREACQIPGVKHVVLFKGPGDRVGPYRDNTDIAGFISVMGPNKAILNDVFDQVEQTLIFDIVEEPHGCIGLIQGSFGT